MPASGPTLSPKTHGLWFRIVNRYLGCVDPVLSMTVFVLLFPLFPLFALFMWARRGRHWLWHWVGLGSRPQVPPLTIADGRPKLRCVAISDTHMIHRELDLPAGDVLIHAGDATNFGRPDEVREFVRWFVAQPHRHKILVPGNHDMIFDRDYWVDFWGDWASTEGSLDDLLEPFERAGVRVLVDETAEVDGVRFHGSPWTAKEYPWRMAFNLLPDDMRDKWGTVPPGTDVLVTHMPPQGKGDLFMDGSRNGSVALREAVDRIQPAFHVFGHIHNDFGAFEGEGRTVFINAAQVSALYSTKGRGPVVFEVPLPGHRYS